MISASLTADYVLGSFESEEKEPFYPWKALPRESEVKRVSKAFPKDSGPTSILHVIEGAKASTFKELMSHDSKEERRGVHFEYVHTNGKEYSQASFSALEVVQAVVNYYKENSEESRKLMNYQGSQLVDYLDKLHEELKAVSTSNAAKLSPALEFCRAVTSNYSNVTSYTRFEREYL